LSTNASDSEVSLSTDTFSPEDIINFISITGNSADSKVRVIESGNWALLTNTSDQVVAGPTDTLTIDDKGVGILADSWRVGKLRSGSGGSCGGNADSSFEAISLDAVTDLLVSVVDCEGRASSANSVDGVKSSDTGASEGGKIKLLIFRAGRSADSILGIVVVRGNAV